MFEQNTNIYIRIYIYCMYQWYQHSKPSQIYANLLSSGHIYQHVCNIGTQHVYWNGIITTSITSIHGEHMGILRALTWSSKVAMTNPPYLIFLVKKPPFVEDFSVMLDYQKVPMNGVDHASRWWMPRVIWGLFNAGFSILLSLLSL